MGRENHKEIVPTDRFGIRDSIELVVGNRGVVSYAISGSELKPSEVELITAARQAYSMWGDASGIQEFDHLDGLAPLSDCNAIHYFSIVCSKDVVPKTKRHSPADYPLDNALVLTMRGNQNPWDNICQASEYSYWCVHPDGENDVISLGDYLQRPAVASRLHTHVSPVTISRLGSYRGNRFDKSGSVCNPIALGFANMQRLLLNNYPETQYIVSQLREELVGSLSVPDSSGKGWVHPEFSRVSDLLSLPVNLNNNIERVRTLKLSYPGYWLDAQKFRHTLLTLFEELISPKELRTPLLGVINEIAQSHRIFDGLLSSGRLKNDDYITLKNIADADASGYKPEEIRLACQVLSYPYLAKHTVPILKMLAYEDAQIFIRDSGDGPFSSMTPRDEWAKSNNDVIDSFQNFS